MPHTPGIYVSAADHANLSLLAVPEPLRGKLRRARVVPSAAVPPDVVTLQSTVTLEDAATGQRTVVSLVYPAEADAARGRLSVLDPVGMELFGARLGDLIGAGAARLRVAQLAYQPERSMRRHLVIRD
jgi:regulator of nucleoside diphosphate kinase